MNKTLYTLYSACSRGGLTAGRSATLDPIAHKKVSASTESSTLSSWVPHRPTAYGVHCPSAAVVTKSRNNLVSSPSSLPYV